MDALSESEKYLISILLQVTRFLPFLDCSNNLENVLSPRWMLRLNNMNNLCNLHNTGEISPWLPDYHRQCEECSQQVRSRNNFKLHITRSHKNSYCSDFTRFIRFCASRLGFICGHLCLMLHLTSVKLFSFVLCRTRLRSWNEHLEGLFSDLNSKAQHLSFWNSTRSHW